MLADLHELALIGVSGDDGGAALLCLGLAVLWGCLACLIARMRGRWRRRAMAVAVALGVPALGWLTYEWGPLMGLAALVTGALTLRWRPRTSSRARLDAAAARRVSP